MRRFLKVLLAVFLCTALLRVSDVYANESTSVTDDSSKDTIQNSIQSIGSAAINSEGSAYSEEEVYLAAQLVYHEAHNQTYRGKIAVAEVLLNRVNSNLFPDSILEVINQKGQFTNARRLKNIRPTEAELEVAKRVLNGNLRAFNDPTILYFRNPEITSGLSASTEKNWGNLAYATFVGEHAFYSQDIPSNEAEVKQPKEKKHNFLEKLLAMIPTADKAKAKDKDKTVKDEKISKAEKKNNKKVSEVKEEDSSDTVSENIIVENTLTPTDGSEVEVIVDDSLGLENLEEIDASKMTPEQLALYQAQQLTQLALASQAAMQNGALGVETTDTISVENMVQMAQANQIALVVESQQKAVAKSGETEYISLSEQIERDRQAEVDRIARENEENARATAAAQEWAKSCEQAEVDRVARQNEEYIKAYNAAQIYAQSLK